MEGENNFTISIDFRKIWRKKTQKLEELKMSETCSQGIYLRNKPQNVLFTLPPDSLVNYLHIPTSKEVIFSFSQSVKHCRIAINIISIKYLKVCKTCSFYICHSPFNFSLWFFLDILKSGIWYLLISITFFFIIFSFVSGLQSFSPCQKDVNVRLGFPLTKTKYCKQKKKVISLNL